MIHYGMKLGGSAKSVRLNSLYIYPRNIQKNFKIPSYCEYPDMKKQMLVIFVAQNLSE